MRHSLLLLLTFFALNASAQTRIPGRPMAPAVLLGITPPLSTLNEAEPEALPHWKKPREVFNGRERGNTEPENRTYGPDPLLNINRDGGATFDVTTDLSFDGLGFLNSYPPDPAGSVGTTHYVQMINGSPNPRLRIFDKAGVQVFNGTTNTIFGQAGVNTSGDPIVVYDDHAQRWLLLAYVSGANRFVVAISQTDNPTGTWRAYAVNTPDFPDYVKMFVWGDAYYVTYKGANNWVPVVALDRAAMLNGDVTINNIAFQIPRYNGQNYQVANGGDWDGATPPPAGSPAYLVRMYDDAWDGGQDKLDVWDLHTDWAVPANSFADGPHEIPVAPFDAEVCGNDFLGCVPQRGSTTKLDCLHKILVHRGQYRNFGDHETMLYNHVVDATGTEQAGIRWYELRKTGNSPWTLYQEGTYAPDTDHRFLGSLAMDGEGNIAMGYSVSSDSLFPSLRATGRRAGDPLGQMTMAELNVAAGVDNNPNGRWGDYSAMSVDPVDDRTFWFTGEYAKLNNFGTRIVSFRLQRDTNDLSVTELVAPQSGPGLGASENVSIRIRNSGVNPQSNFAVSYRLDNGTQVIENIASPLAPDSSIVHTFAVPVDLSAPATDYTFVATVSVAGDLNPSNDTLCKIVRHTPVLDASVLSVWGLMAPWCGTSQDVTVRIYNGGSTPINSLDINYQVNNGTVNTVALPTALAPFATATVVISPSGANIGANTLTVYTSQPNGQADQVPSNDALALPFEVTPNGLLATLAVTTDNSPWETTWQIEDENGVAVYMGGPYTVADTTYIHTFCLIDSSCYLFSFYDSYGDGLDDGTPGDFVLTLPDGRTPVEMAQADFGSEVFDPFCSTCSPFNLTVNIQPEAFPGANNGRFIIIASGGQSPYQYSKDGGQTFQLSFIFSNLTGGDYTAVVRDAEGCTDTVIVTIPTLPVGIGTVAAPAIRASVEPNPASSMATLVVEGLPAGQELRVEATDLSGKVFLSKNYSLNGELTRTPIDLSGLPAGMYVFRFVGEEEIAPVKVVKL